MPKYKIGDRVRTLDFLHGHDSRTIFGTIGAMESDEFGDTCYGINWDEGGVDWLYDTGFELGTEYVYLAQVTWDIRTHNSHQSGNAVVGVYRNETVMLDNIKTDILAKVRALTGHNLNPDCILVMDGASDSIEVSGQDDYWNILGFAWKQYIKEE